MKKIEAFIQHRVLPLIVLSLNELPNFPGLSVTEVLGQGRGRGTTGDYIHTEQNLPFHRRNLIQIVCDDDAADEIVNRILATAHSATNGDGLVIVTNLERCERVRIGEPLAPPQL